MCTFFLLRGFIFHSPVGSTTPQEGRTHAGKQSEMDRAEPAEEAERNRVAPDGPSPRVSRKQREGGDQRMVEVLADPEELCTAAALLLPLVTGEVGPHR